jgi:hypothetical protein
LEDVCIPTSWNPLVGLDTIGPVRIYFSGFKSILILLGLEDQKEKINECRE